jgi:hypothetical protein
MTTLRLLHRLNHIDNRYPNPSEEAEMSGYMASVPARFAALRDLEATAPSAVAAALERIAGLYPEMESRHEHMWAKGMRDLVTCLTVAGQAMLLDDIDLAEQRLYGWLRTIFRTSGMPAAFVKATHAAVRDELVRRLAPASRTLLAAHLDFMVERTAAYTDLPAPTAA